jgi:plasmid stability protein
MRVVPTLHIRNVPSDVYEQLKQQAAENSRSLNAEVLDILSGAAASRQREAVITRRLRELAHRYPLPPDAPAPEELIREGRDERARRLRR